MTTHALRITLSNEPGALARASSVMAELGVNIVAVDVHELDGIHVVDEIVVWMPENVSPGDLRAALLEVGCQQVESMPNAHHTTDAIVRCLDGLARCIPESVGQQNALLEMVTQLMPGATARVIGAADTTEAAEAVHRGVPVSSSATGRNRAWTVVLPYPEDAPSVGIELYRERLRPSATEIARVRALLRVHRMIAGAVPAVVVPTSGGSEFRGAGAA